jgi:acetyl-CoA carboxylase carboxyl transferase subunit alpha
MAKDLTETLVKSVSEFRAMPVEELISRRYQRLTRYEYGR